MSKKLYDFIIRMFEKRRVDGSEEEWNKAKYAAVLDWGSGYSVQPILNDKEIEDIIKDQINHKDYESYELTFYDESRRVYKAIIDSFEYHLEEE